MAAAVESDGGGHTVGINASATCHGIRNFGSWKSEHTQRKILREPSNEKPGEGKPKLLVFVLPK